jgi:Fe(3+) dicitrate transport protein
MLGTLEYADDPYQAPTGRLDRFQQDRTAITLTHNWTPGDRVRLSTTAYYVDTFRASFRQTDKPGGYDDGPDERGISTGYTTLDRCYDEDDPAPGTGGSADNPITRAASQACGGRWRPRSFEYFGIEPRLDLSHDLFGISSDTVIGGRYHHEDIERNQFRTADPRIQNLSFTSELIGFDSDDPRDVEGFGDEHREQVQTTVDAFSLYIQNSLRFGDFALTAGLRLEDVKTRTATLRSGSEPDGRVIDRTATELLPGLGLAWTGLAGTTVFAGVHRGFAPPRPSRDVAVDDDDVQPEQSTNYELGFRSTPVRGVSIASTLFYTDFTQIVISSAAGAFVNGGRSEQAGLELSGRIDVADMTGSGSGPYLQGNYTNLFTARFLTTSDAAFNAGDGGVVGAPCEEDEGCYNGNGILRGSRLPYAPRHNLSLNLGYRHQSGIDARVGIDHRSSQQPDPFARVLDTTINDSGCSDATCSGLAGTIDGVTLLNASINFDPPGSRFSYFVAGYNLADRTYLASRVDGMVAGRRLSVLGGVRVRF